MAQQPAATRSVIKPVVVSFYTREGAYREFAETLRASCERFGLEHRIEELPSTGSWQRNTTLKPNFVYQKLLELKRPIVWCDADCEFRAEPTLFYDARHDFMIYNWIADQENPREMFNPELLADTELGAAGGVFYLSYQPQSLQWVFRWMEWCKKLPTLVEDQVLNVMWPRVRPKELRSRWLPRSYNRMDSLWPQVQPVVNHVYTKGGIFTGEFKAPPPAIPEELSGSGGS